MSRHFKPVTKGIEFKLIRGKHDCIKRGHQNIEIEINLERYGIFIVIKDCSDCVRTMINAINRCRSKNSLFILLTALKEKYKNDNQSKHIPSTNPVFPVQE